MRGDDVEKKRRRQALASKNYRARKKARAEEEKRTEATKELREEVKELKAQINRLNHQIKGKNDEIKALKEKHWRLECHWQRQRFPIRGLCQKCESPLNIPIN
jgi:predicted  nucleic acid-binding Zn-ribbon protein